MWCGSRWCLFHFERWRKLIHSKRWQIIVRVNVVGFTTLKSSVQITSKCLLWSKKNERLKRIKCSKHERRNWRQLNEVAAACVRNESRRAVGYMPCGRRNPERPKGRWRDQLHIAGNHVQLYILRHYFLEHEDDGDDYSEYFCQLLLEYCKHSWAGIP